MTTTTTTITPEQDAAYWKERYEEERARVMKLWIAYQTLEADLQSARRATEEDAPERADAEGPVEDTGPEDSEAPLKAPEAPPIDGGDDRPNAA